MLGSYALKSEYCGKCCWLAPFRTHGVFIYANPLNDTDNIIGIWFFTEAMCLIPSELFYLWILFTLHESTMKNNFFCWSNKVSQNPAFMVFSRTFDERRLVRTIRSNQRQGECLKFWGSIDKVNTLTGKSPVKSGAFSMLKSEYIFL